MNNNDYGVYKEGTDLWVEVEVPLTLTEDTDDAIDNWSFAEASSVATYLSQGGENFRVGRPDDRHG